MTKIPESFSLGDIGLLTPYEALEQINQMIAEGGPDNGTEKSAETNNEDQTDPGGNFMSHVTWRGVELDRRTAEMCDEAARLVGPNILLDPTQGSYRGGKTERSADTHDGGGAVDFSVRGLTLAKILKVVMILRIIGFAAWYRRSPEWSGPVHIHAIAVACKDLSPGAQKQVADLRKGRNGLVNHLKDRHADMKLPVVTWEQYLAKRDRGHLPKINTSPLKKILTKVTQDIEFWPSYTDAVPGSRDISRWCVGSDVALIQRFLGVGETSKFGPVTESAVKRYQKMRGLPVTGEVDTDNTWPPILSALGLDKP